MKSNDIFNSMCDKAVEELASGGTGWKEVDTNTLLLACFGMFMKLISNRLMKPLWLFASSVFIGVVIYILTEIIFG